MLVFYGDIHISHTNYLFPIHGGVALVEFLQCISHFTTSFMQCNFGRNQSDVSIILVQVLTTPVLFKKLKLSSLNCFSSHNSFGEDIIKVLTPATYKTKHEASLSESVTASILHFLISIRSSFCT